MKKLLSTLLFLIPSLGFGLDKVINAPSGNLVLKGTAVTSASPVTLSNTVTGVKIQKFTSDTVAASYSGPGVITIKAPTQTVLGSGSGTYTKPTDALWLRVRMVGGGGGGGCQAQDGGTGENTTFGSLVAYGGDGGGGGYSAGVGGCCSNAQLCICGGNGSLGGPGTGGNTPAGHGGSSPFGGQGYGAGKTVTGYQSGSDAQANTGSGGGGSSFGDEGRSGGGAGGYLENIISNPSATYSYTVGAKGVGGCSTGHGGRGVIIVEEHYY